MRSHESSVSNETVNQKRQHRTGLWVVVLIIMLGLITAALLLGQAVGQKQGEENAQVANSSAVPDGTVSSSSTVSSGTVSSSASSSPSLKHVQSVQFPDVTKTAGLTGEGVARLAVQSMTTWDSASDSSDADAVVRTEPLFSPALASKISTDAGQVPWSQAVVAREGYSTPSVKDYDIYSGYQNVPAPTAGYEAGVQTYQFMVNWDWVSVDGSKIESSEAGRVYTVSVVPKSSGWEIVDYSWRSEKL